MSGKLHISQYFAISALLIAISVAGGCGSGSSSRPIAPSITAQPSNQTVIAGQSASFSVGATGTSPLTYQWQKNGAVIPSATAATYTIPVTVMGDNGAQFRVIVSNAAGQVTSNPATLTVSPAATAPVITTQPGNQSVTVGQIATFTIAATGTAPLTYQWQRNGVAISGATAATYTTPATLIGDNGAQFQVVVSNFAGQVTSSVATLTVNAAANAPVITTQPANQSVTIGQAAIFSVAATGTSPLNYQWQKNEANIPGATSATYTTPATVSGDNGAQFRVVVTNLAGQVTSNVATLTVTSAPGVDVVTYHNDNARTGQNLKETILTVANVNSSNFGKVGFFATDGKVDAEPLYLSSVNVAGKGIHNVLYVVTEHDTVYAFDADTGAKLWQVSLLGSGETTSDDHGCNQITPEIGITSTPVIDRTAGANGVIYTVAMSKKGSAYFQRLHALDIRSGAEALGGPATIQASFPGTGDNSSGGTVTFDPKQYAERAGLLLLNGAIYTGWTSHCDSRPYTGWIMGYNATTLAQSSVLNLTPNGSEGSIWMSGSGLAADRSDNIYFLDANGSFDTALTSTGFPANGNYGNSFMKLSTSGGLSVADYFATFDTVQKSNADTDLGSGGALLLPDLSDGAGQTFHVAVGAGKDSNIYVVNRDNMGKYNSTANNIYQELPGVLPGGVWAMPSYFNNAVYYGSVGSTLKAFTISNAKLSASPTSHSSATFPYPGSTPSVSANGSSDGIVWAHANSNPAILHAYDATDLSHELYNSNQAGSRDQFGPGNKFITPMVVNGRVYVGTATGVAVFGLLH